MKTAGPVAGRRARGRSSKAEIGWIRRSIWFETRADAHADLFEFIETLLRPATTPSGTGHLTPTEYADEG